MAGKYTDEDLAGLTEAEREALLEDEDTQDDPEVDQDTDQEDVDVDVDQDDDTQDESDADTEDTGDDDGDTDDEGEQDDDDQAGGDETQEEETQRTAPHVPILDATEPEDADERLEQITTQKEQLVQQFDDGELTAKEYQQQLDTLSRQEREIEQERFKAKLAAEMQEQQAKQKWLDTVSTFLDENPTYRQSELMYRTLDMVVVDLAKKEENAGLTGREILERAHQQITEQFGLQQEQDSKPATKVAKKASRKTIQAPPTLAKVPAADTTEVENTKWSKLDRLAQKDPLAYEKQMAKMSDAERDEYLAAG